MRISTAVVTVLAAFTSVTQAASLPRSAADVPDTFDYVIVGGGVGGLTLASRLSDNKDVTVAVLEAGPNANDQFVIYAPGMYGQAVGTDLCPLRPTVPQEHMNDRTITIATGKLLGGGSAVNGLVWTRGAAKDYDAWEELGNKGWNWENMFKYFKKVETFHPPTEDQVHYGATYDKKSHGTNGRVPIGFPNYEFSQSANWNQSLASLDFTHRQDLLNGSLHGYSTTPNTLNPETATRADSYAAYIDPVIDQRSNLFVLANRTVSRVKFDESKSDQGLVATGVEWYPTGNNANKKTIKARREVILSSGSIGSPKLLEVSGVGATHILEAAGVKTLLNLPGVGSNLQDHVHAVTVTTTNIDGYTTNSVFTNDTLAAEQRKLYKSEKQGIWTTTPNNLGYPSPTQLFEDTLFKSAKHFAAQIRDSSDHYAEFYSSMNATNAKLLKKQYEIVASRYEADYMSPIEINFTPGYGGTANVDLSKKYQTVNHVLVAPLSRGFTHINSSDIEDPVVIDPHYYSHPLDVDIHVASTKLARKILAAPALAELSSGEVEPGSDITSDEDVKTWLTNNVRSDWHPIGTCAMLPESLGGVVDNRLKVYGTANLRVVDASIMPLQVSSHLMAPTYSIAEKAADLIAEDAQ